MTNEIKIDRDELKACPCCTSAVVLEEHPAHSHAGGVASFMPDYPGSASITCTNDKCNIGMIAATADEVIAAWNMRASIQPVATQEDAGKVQAEESIESDVYYHIQELMSPYVAADCAVTDKTLPASVADAFSHLLDFWLTASQPSNAVHSVTVNVIECLEKISSLCPQDEDIDQLDNSEVMQRRVHNAEIGDTARVALYQLHKQWITTANAGKETSPPFDPLRFAFRNLINCNYEADDREINMVFTSASAAEEFYSLFNHEASHE